MMKTITSILLLIFLQNSVFANNNSPLELKSVPLLKRFESIDYKGGIQNWSFDQDSAGLLYVANNEGLLEFDGNKWYRYEVPFCTKVRAVLVDSENRIFVGGQGQIGYFEMNGNGLLFTSLLNHLPTDLQNISEVWKILEFKGAIYFVTESQLFVYENKELKLVAIPGFMRMAFNVEDRFFVQIYEKGIFEMMGSNFISISGTHDMTDVVSIMPKKDEGYFYFCRNGDVYFNDSNNNSVEPYEIDSLGAINEVIKLHDGLFVAGTQNNGLFILNSDLDIVEHYTKNEGLSDRSVKALYEDDCNNLWVALNNGIDYLEISLPLKLINDEVGLEGTGYAACVFKNRVYLGTSNGLFIDEPVERKNNSHYYKLVSGSDGQVYNFSIINDDLILNHNRGAFQIYDNKISQFHDIGSWKFIKSNKDDVVLGGDYHGISFFKKINGKWTKIGEVPDFMESSRIMQYENDSTLWMTHGLKGAYRLIFDEELNLNKEIEKYGEDEGFPSNLMISVYSLNGNLVFTSEKGIFNYNNSTNQFVPNDFFNSWLGTGHIASIASNGSNTIYYIQNYSFGALIQESFGSYKIESGVFKHINEYINDDLPNISIINDENVLIGAKEGFVLYDPTKTNYINTDFNVILKSVEVQSIYNEKDKYIPQLFDNLSMEKSKTITFNYAAPYFDGYQDIKYSYRLLPIEKEWSSWNQNGEKEYTYIPPDDYTFEVKAINIYGNETPISSFSFTIITPWYASSFAIGGYIFIFLLIIAIILIFQKKKYLEENIQLSKNSEEALRIKSDEIDQISQDSKKEINRLINEKLRSELNLKNDQLTTITFHHMKNNEFFHEIRKKLQEFLDNNGSKHDIRGILRKIDENLHNNDSWEQFAYHFDQVHGDYLKKLSKANVRLSPREIKLAAFLRMNMSSKEISNLMNITVRGVELARHRLRKKLNLSRDQNLVEYLIDLDNS